MNTITFRVDAADAVRAFERAPEVMRRHVSDGAQQGADVIARAARRQVAFKDVFGTLRQSIHVAPVPSADGVIAFEARTAANYARYVEEGTGPAVGRPKYYPNPESLLQYLTHSPRLRGFKWKGKEGSAARTLQQDGLEWRARAMAWSIYNRGTKPKPYMAPAAAASDASVRAILKGATARGIAEVFGAG